MTLVDRLDQHQGLWAEKFRFECPDSLGEPTEPPEQQLEDLLGRQIGDQTGWPLSQVAAGTWSQDDLFDLMEVLHDLSSWPGTWDRHDFGGCPGHPGDFSAPCGQGLYRHEVNELLARSDLGVRIANGGKDQGRIIMHDGDALGDAVDHALRSAPTGYADDVSHAVMLFRSRERDVASMRSAVVALAGVLEAHRTLLKGELLSKDDGALFAIANDFDLRHRKAGQRTDYEPAFLEWLFHWYLATVSLTDALLTRQGSSRVQTGAEAGADG